MKQSYASPFPGGRTSTEFKQFPLMRLTVLPLIGGFIATLNAGAVDLPITR
jgi:hypothetical protein